jgi:hypothetical protein
MKKLRVDPFFKKSRQSEKSESFPLKTHCKKNENPYILDQFFMFYLTIYKKPKIVLKV